MCPLPCGVRRAQLVSSTVQLGFPALVRGIMGGLRCADQEKERDCSSGWLRACVCVCLFGRRHASVKSSPNARLFLLLKTFKIFLRSAHLSHTAVVLFACKCVHIPLLSHSRAPTEGSCVYIDSIVTMCALSLHSSGFYWEMTSQTGALLIWDLFPRLLQLNIWRPQSPHACSDPLITCATLISLTTRRLRILWNLFPYPSKMIHSPPPHLWITLTCLVTSSSDSGPIRVNIHTCTHTP